MIFIKIECVIGEVWLVVFVSIYLGINNLHMQGVFLCNDVFEISWIGIE